jgi:predicted enzyme related to lactoylglutathione lyase
MGRFFHYQLRTTDTEAGLAFYGAVLGGGNVDAVALHAQALARGARPHWLGYIDVPDVDAVASAFGAHGALPLGVKWTLPEGGEAWVVRTRGGEIVALAQRAGSPETRQVGTLFPEVVWHALNTANVEDAKASYAELLGWELREPVTLSGVGVVHPFAWHRGGAEAGSMLDIADRPGVHPHWLFAFRVRALAPALEAVRAGGGSYLDPFSLPTGDRIAVCDDPQGAAFGLLEHGS